MGFKGYIEYVCPNSNCLNTIIIVLHRETRFLRRREDDYCFNEDCIICLTDNINRDLLQLKEDIHRDIRWQAETTKHELDLKSGVCVVSTKTNYVQYCYM